jgi:DNA-binding CsgD family transcriptional regulator
MKTLVSSFVSALSLALTCCWIWQAGDIAVWSDYSFYSDIASYFVGLWCIFTALTLLVVSMCFKHFEGNIRIVIVAAGSLVIGEVLAVLVLFGKFSQPAIYLLAIGIGIYYGMGFSLWLLMSRAKPYRQVARESSAGVILSGLAYLAFSNLGIWAHGIAMLLIPIIVFIAQYILLIYRLPVSSVPASNEHRPKKIKLLPVVIVVGFTWAVVIQTYIVAAGFEWVAGAVIAGFFVLAVIQASTVEKSFFTLFALVSALICLSCLAALVFHESLNWLAASALMTGFYSILLFLLSTSARTESQFFFQGTSVATFQYLTAFFIAVALSRMYILLDIPYLVSLTISALLLAAAAVLASIGLMSKNYVPALAQTDRDDKTCAFELQQQYTLTDRERDVMLLLAKGHSLDYIAEQMFLSPNTVKTYRNTLYAKLGVHKKQEVINLINSR